MSTEHRAVEPDRRAADVGWSRIVLDLAPLGVALPAWGLLLRGLDATEIGLLALAVPPLAALCRAVDRWLGGQRAWAGVVAMGIVGFAAVVGLTGASPLALAGFILGLVKPVGWTGDHLLLRVVPLGMLLGYPWRPSWPGALVSALGVGAFLGVGLMILRSAG